jgi:anti-sigma regulatory factor (Ser/Thr protein kinase)
VQQHEGAVPVSGDGVFAARIPADPAALAGVRDGLGSWLRAHGLENGAIDDIVLAVHEAAANAAEHAYADSPHEGNELEVRCGWLGDRLACVVSDRGRWRRPGAPGDRGRGLQLIRTLVDEVDVDRSSTGTTVEMRWSSLR